MGGGHGGERGEGGWGDAVEAVGSGRRIFVSTFTEPGFRSLRLVFAVRPRVRVRDLGLDFGVRVRMKE